MPTVANSINASQQGTQYLSTAGAWTGVDASTSGFVLTSNGTGAVPSFQANAGSTAIQTIQGDTGSVTGTTVSVKGASTAGASVKFTGSGTAMTLAVSDASFNMFMGASSGNGTTTALRCTGIGAGAFTALTTAGNDSVAIGTNCCAAMTSGGNNTAVGSSCLSSAQTSAFNAAFGTGTLSSCTGSSNTAFGNGCGTGITSGTLNCLFGASAGDVLNTTDSSNICISNGGTSGDNNTIRIGTQGTGSGLHNKCFIAGIAAVTSSNPTVVTQNSSTTQIGVDTTNFTILSTGLQLRGNNTNTAPPAGFIGEQIRSTANGSITSTTAANVTSISLTAGIWDVTGIVNYAFTTSASSTTTGISATSGTFTGTQGDNFVNEINAFGLNSQVAVSIPSFRVTLASTTTYYLVQQATFVSTATAFGRLSATRVG